MNYQITPIYLGKSRTDRSTLLLRYPPGEATDITYYAFLLRGEDGETVLFDTGTPEPDIMQQPDWKSARLQDARSYRKEIEKLGVRPEEVSLIILSHLHWDHSYNLEHFPNARILVQRKELHYAVAPQKHERRPYSMLPGTQGPHWWSGLLQMEAVDGDCEIGNGIRILETPGHTPGSQSLAVDTADGTVILTGDLIYCKESWETGWPAGTLYSSEDWYRSYEKVKKEGGKIWPSHNLEEFISAECQ